MLPEIFTNITPQIAERPANKLRQIRNSAQVCSGLALCWWMACLTGCAGLASSYGLSGLKSSATVASPPTLDAISQADSAALVSTQKNEVISENSINEPVVPAGYTSGAGFTRSEACPPLHLDDSACYSQCEPAMGGHRQRVRDQQEYIFDGGDIEPKVAVRRDWSAAGVDATDTVVYYETPGGKVCVHPSNRVAIYAPRFGVVRQVTGAVFAENTLSPGRVFTPVSPSGLEEQNRVSGVSLSTGPIAQKQMFQLDRFHDERNPVPMASVIPPTPMSDAVSALINVDVSTTDQANLLETTAIEDLTAMVQTIWLPESLSIYVSGSQAQAVSDAKNPAEVVVYDTQDGCSIRIEKQVSHREADPGDIIRFSIKFENIGPSKAGNVVIIDSLSPRLGYIEGSQLSSVKTRFIQTPNSVGSSELRWELDSVFEVNNSGVISFDCRVR